MSCVPVPSSLTLDCRWAASISDEEVSSRLGPHGAGQGASCWSIIYYRTPLLLLCVTNALSIVVVPEVNAARLTLSPLTNTASA